MNTQTEPNYLNATHGWKSWVFTLDHKRIGLMYLAAIFFFFFVGGLMALLVRTELWNPVRTFAGAQAYNQFFTLHGAIMVFLVIIPGIPAGLGNFVLPLQLGAKDVAFPKLNLTSYYIYVVGATMALAAIIGGGVDTGWTFYTPYSTQASGQVILVVMAAFVLGFSSIFTGMNFLVTVHKLRAPGMSWFKMPLFVWGMYATAIIQIMATPALAITLCLLVLERAVGIGIFDPALGGDPVLFQHFFWFYSHPAVYIMILPGMAIISELVSTFSQKRIFGYKLIAFSSVAIAIISFLVWGHHMFVSGQSVLVSMLFSALTMLVAIPSGIKVFNWVMTMYEGSISWEAPMLYAFSFLFLFTIGGVTGLYLATMNTDVHLHDTYFVVAHFHYVMVGGTFVAFVGGMFYWWPKMTGRMYNNMWGAVSAWMIFIGFNVTFFTQFLLGSQGMPRRYYNYLEQFQTLHRVSTVGSYLLGLGFLIAAICLLSSLRKNGNRSHKNQWHGRSLEWTACSAPPIEHNFHNQPVVTHGPYEYDLPESEVDGSVHSNSQQVGV